MSTRALGSVGTSEERDERIELVSEERGLSGEVRIKGRHSVTFTVSSKASALAGISAWS